jgi:hypothetical protein
MRSQGPRVQLNIIAPQYGTTVLLSPFPTLVSLPLRSPLTVHTLYLLSHVLRQLHSVSPRDLSDSPHPNR